jgi:hypothetical protein
LFYLSSIDKSENELKQQSHHEHSEQESGIDFGWFMYMKNEPGSCGYAPNQNETD